MKHDRKICAENTFRGKNMCEGYYIAEGSIIICPCKCHKETSEETIIKAKQYLSQK